MRIERRIEDRGRGCRRTGITDLVQTSFSFHQMINLEVNDLMKGFSRREIRSLALPFDQICPLTANNRRGTSDAIEPRSRWSATKIERL